VALSRHNVNLAYNENANDIGSLNSQNDRELRLRLSGGLKNDRILFQVGSQFGIGRPGAAQSNFFGEDVVIEFLITPNRHWRLKVFQRLEPGIDGGSRNSFGTGLSFRRDYSSFEEMSKGLSSWFRTKKRKG
jgi:TamB, inner membrane protein subunit of TAM complex